MKGLNLAFVRWVLAFAAFCSFAHGSAIADSWSPPEKTVYVSANGQYRLTVVPRKIDSALEYFQAKVDNRTLPKRLGPSATLERMVDGKWQAAWSNVLVNEVSPVSALVSDDGSRVVTFDNWHSAGYGKDVVVIYGSDGSLVKSFALSQIVPAYFLDGFQRSVSSIWWQDSDPIITDSVLELHFAAPAANENKRLKFTVSVALEDGSVMPIPDDIMQRLTPMFCEAHKSQVAGTNEYIAYQRNDLVAPSGNDRDQWTRYWYQAMQRLRPDEPPVDGDLFGDEIDFELLGRGEYMEKDFRDGFNEALLAPRDEIPRRWFTSVDQNLMTSQIEKISKKIRPGQLVGVEMRFFVDSAYWPRISKALSASGAQLVQINPAIPIPQKPEALAALPANPVVDKACAT